MNLTTGTTLQGGKYILHQGLGHSQLSLTFKATQSALNQAVVIKTLKPDAPVLVDLAVRKQQFTEKMRLFSQCHHPALVKILDGFEEGQLPFVVTDYVAGQSLVEVVKQRGALPESQALQFLRQASSALSQLHRGGVIHGDVKPANLIALNAKDRYDALRCRATVHYVISQGKLLARTEAPRTTWHCDRE